MQTGARRATSATGAKTGKGKNGEVIVEKVMTSDSFLSREIKKAPLIEHDGSLVADISHIPNDLKITIQGAREHNLKNVDLAIPRNRMVVFTGLSGSGKSSLAFDTLFAEGQRRYVESLSAYARQFLGQMDKPDVDFIEGLSPAVSIDQKTTNRNPRSTVGTITEIYDYLRLLFARTGIPHCPECGEPVASQTPQQIVDTLLGYPERTRFQILSPVVKGRKGEFVDMIELLRSDGYARALIDGEMTQLSDDIKLTKQKKHTIEVVVDRLVVKDGIRQRLTDSVETALKLANGSIVIDFVDEEEGSPARRQPFSEHRSCPNGHTLELDEVEPRTFSFNAPYGACPACTGLGFKLEIDPDLIISDPDKSLADGVIEPWSGTKMTSQYYGHILEGLAKEMGFSMKTPWKGLPDDVKHDILYGHDFKVNVSYRNRWGRLREYSTGFEGVIRTLMRRHDETDSQSMREYYESYMREVPCQVCHGRRLKPEVLAVTVDGKSIFDVCDMPVVRELAWINGLKLEGSAQLIAGEVLKEIKARLGFLNDVGLDYLTLSRAAATLSGGEAQRIRLATQIGSGLVGVMYVLDEPSIGLHPRDNERLIATLRSLQGRGNTVLVVEHDEATIREADHIIELGPGSGAHGGDMVYHGSFENLIKHSETLTAKYMRGDLSVPIPDERREPKGWLTLRGVTTNNLKDIDCPIPLGTLTCVTGVSGSGKSSLVVDTLYKHLALAQGIRVDQPGSIRGIDGVEAIERIVAIDQTPIGRTPRSNPATYTKIFDEIRNIFAMTPDARKRGYKPGRFSFNVRGGRCEACGGDGQIRVEMHFLPDVYVTCDVCKGRRYNHETLEVRYKGLNIAEVLDLPVQQARAFFENYPVLERRLAVLEEVGLEYLRLGQPATTLSGGEAQRIKISRELGKRSLPGTLYILDEPTTGLHMHEVGKLIKVLHALVDKGASVVVIEHNTDMILAADHVLDMGPGGGENGGLVVSQGTPEAIVADPDSVTGRFLMQERRDRLKRRG